MTAILPVPDPGTIDRIAPTLRPVGRAIGYHRWTNLLFVHWRVPAGMIRPLLPRELTLDTWEGDAWVGLVPFFMSGVRPWWSPPILGLSSFCETNVRTYVHFRGREPGVWFFSLDASSSLAVRVARWRWHLPYFRAQMKLTRSRDTLEYESQRLWPESAVPGTASAGCRIRASIGPPLRNDAGGGAPVPGRAAPGTLDHFLIERYILYASSAAGKLLAGRVHHRTYPIREASLDHLDETLLAAIGVVPPVPPCHTLFSDGVDVEIFPLRPCTSGFQPASNLGRQWHRM
jgi:uncharacterized protein YqjF (DUF2071 family)